MEEGGEEVKNPTVIDPWGADKRFIIKCDDFYIPVRIKNIDSVVDDEPFGKRITALNIKCEVLYPAERKKAKK